jgi:hypothetical protein
VEGLHPAHCKPISAKVAPDVRLPRVVARAALIAALASGVVPAVAGSRIPSAPQALDPSTFHVVDLGQAKTSMTIPLLDPANRSAGNLELDGVLQEPWANAPGTSAPAREQAASAPKPVVESLWHLDNNISWYGPGFWGANGACGMFGANGFDENDVGVAHRTLPCGTKVTFRYNGRTVTARVVDRGPYVDGRTWDMTKGLCSLLGHCFTGGGVYWHLG